jgi:hypothetical protein
LIIALTQHAATIGMLPAARHLAGRPAGSIPGCCLTPCACLGGRVIRRALHISIPALNQQFLHHRDCTQLIGQVHPCSRCGHAARGARGALSLTALSRRRPPQRDPQACLSVCRPLYRHALALFFAAAAHARSTDNTLMHADAPALQIKVANRHRRSFSCQPPAGASGATARTSWAWRQIIGYPQAS